MANKTERLPVIPYGTIPNILLLGNGINKAFGKSSWDDLINEMATEMFTDEEKKRIETMPYPLRPVIVTNDQVDRQLDKISSKMAVTDLEPQQAELIRELVSLNFDGILTTNYTYEIETAIDENFYCKPKSACKNRKYMAEVTSSDKQFGLQRCMKLSDAEGERYIWHIHGEAALPKTMILGHYYYGKLLSKIQQYIKDFKKRYEGCNRHEKDFQPQSWIDYFLIGNVYIVGFGLDLAEMDLWWLLNCKKRNCQNQSKVFFFEPNMEDEGKYTKKMLAKAYGVEIITKNVQSDYQKYYHDTVEEVKNQLFSKAES